MPRVKEKAAMYVRESKVELFDSNTIESQANAVRAYCEKEGYELLLEHEYIEAISGYMVVYTERERLMDLLAAAKRQEFTVLVVSEIRALSRRGQAEIFIIYDFLKKYGVRLETISEKFEDSAMGRFMLSVRAMVAEVERQKTIAQAMLVAHEENGEERLELEKTINDFEAWCARVQADLNNPDFEPTYEHLRNTVRMLGIQVTVFPSIGDWPYRYQIDCTLPDVAEKTGSSIKAPFATST